MEKHYEGTKPTPSSYIHICIAFLVIYVGPNICEELECMGSVGKLFKLDK